MVAHTPGVASLFASASNVTSQPLDFTTCAVQSITLAVTGSNSNSISVTVGNRKDGHGDRARHSGKHHHGDSFDLELVEPFNRRREHRGRSHDYQGRRRNRDRLLHATDVQYRN